MSYSVVLECPILKWNLEIEEYAEGYMDPMQTELRGSRQRLVFYSAGARNIPPRVVVRNCDGFTPTDIPSSKRGSIPGELNPH
mmetsp:Transcript_6997/g.10487  ORF Transcript_6997/g.10487 Transcript_6997/m.10487 type:complete len:83 (-) Transcript_6997:63-311(-)